MKSASNSTINSKVYWDQRFQGDWEEKHGREQTQMFYSLMLHHLPPFINDFIATKTSTINDLACALGEGTKLIQEQFPNQIVEGTDFSSNAIENAKQTYPNLRFSVQDINHLPKRYDVMIASNVIEHFKNPLVVLGKILKKTKKVAIIMLPFQEEKDNLVTEHTKSFDFEDFPIIKDDYFLLYSKEIVLIKPAEVKYWHGKQIILVYAKKSAFSQKQLTLVNYHDCNINKDEMIRTLRKTNKRIKASVQKKATVK